ncbi:G-type lectin S-receptor-like serine/threonine-protein kinase RKS1 [Hevea brasiliensis]|uniref:G-type lectin S-receptor-like serine/threonine-protein kinase RKS1 n=1 Tax=Hevea brasiliensis TaxID=3981 RepID=UPI0025CD8F49|nr:G-type lectin S-receptor-like serine/threonine-protein kinase RKS1 [Hevea brasiliensis]
MAYVDNENEISFSWNNAYGSILTRAVLNESGIFQRSKWHENEGRWEEFASAPKDQCDSYGLCGAYGNYVRYNGEFDCTSLPGNGEGFVEVANVKAPDTSVAHVLANLDTKACKNECLRNCSCTAYASLGTTEGSGCLTWYGDLLDTRVFKEGGQSIYVRVDALELAQNGQHELSIYSSSTLPDDPPREKELDRSGSHPHLPFFNIDTIVEATDNFSNKLGEDASMEPKISDFGLAKLFKEHQIEAITKQVVGTYYGVLILEITSGKKNTQYDKESPSLNLIGNVWKLWREGKGLEIVDYSLLEHSYPCQEILRCIQIGLL